MQSAGSCPLPSAPGTANIHRHAAPGPGIPERPKVGRPEELQAGRERGCPCSSKKSQIKSAEDFAADGSEPQRRGVSRDKRRQGAKPIPDVLVRCRPTVASVAAAERPSQYPRGWPPAAPGVAGRGGAAPFPSTFLLGDGHQAAAGDARRALPGRPDQSRNTFSFYLSDFETLSA